MRVGSGSVVGLLFVSAVVLSQSLAWDPTATALARDPSIAPGHRLALGVTRRPAGGIGRVDAFTDQMGGRAPASWTIASDWLGPNAAFPDPRFLDDLWRRRIVPLIFWEPDDPSEPTKTVATYREIVAGKFDAYLHSWARAAATWGGPVIVRFAHEMDGTWFPWSVNRPGNAPPTFVRAWRRIWNIFKGPRGEGASNVRFLWSPFAPCVCGAGLYPGDAYVDYVGFTGLNWANTQRPWAPMSRLFGRAINQLEQFSSRPVIVPEVGSVDQLRNGRSLKPGWIAGGYAQVFERFPRVVLAVYLDVDLRQQANWSLTSPPRALEVYAQLMAKPEFQGSILWKTERPRPRRTPDPTRTPTPTVVPTAEPTVEPTSEPTVEPTFEPTAEPSVEPRASPSEAPPSESIPAELSLPPEPIGGAP